MTLEEIEQAVTGLTREAKVRLVRLVVEDLGAPTPPAPPASVKDDKPDTMTAQDLGVELGHEPDWVYHQAKKPGTLVHACRLIVDGRPRFSRRLLERARRARSRQGS
jgi:hypothetical protein